MLWWATRMLWLTLPTVSVQDLFALDSAPPAPAGTGHEAASADNLFGDFGSASPTVSPGPASTTSTAPKVTLSLQSETGRMHAMLAWEIRHIRSARSLHQPALLHQFMQQPHKHCMQASTLSKSALPEDIFSEVSMPPVPQPSTYGNTAQACMAACSRSLCDRSVEEHERAYEEHCPDTQGPSYSMAPPQAAGNSFPQQQGFAQFPGQQGAMPHGGQQGAAPYGQQQAGMPSYGAMLSAAPGQMGASGGCAAGFGSVPPGAQQPQQGYGSGSLEPQAHIGDLTLTKGKSGQQQPASNGNDPFAGLGF